jgi:hypothetical protein
MARPRFKQAQANIAAYVVALASLKLGDRLNLDRIWQRQAISKQLLDQLTQWADEAEKALQASAGGRMISEQAKRPECWRDVQDHSFSAPSGDIPELA